MSNFKSELKGLNRFQPIPRDLIQDCGLSAQARFIYAYMAAKPEGWEFWQDVMSREVGMGVATLRKYLFELRDAGWLEIGKQKNDRGFGAIQYTLKAIPCYNFCDTQNLRHAENASRDFCDTQNLRHAENASRDFCDTQNLQDLNNINTTNKIDTNIKKKKSSDAPLILPFSSDKFREVWEMLCEEKEWKKKTANALRLALKDLSKYDEEFAIELMEKTIKNGWRGVVFPDTDAKYQEWKSARQQAIDNQQARGTTASRPRPPQNSQIDEFYRKKREREEQDREEQIAALKAKYGNTD